MLQIGKEEISTQSFFAFLQLHLHKHAIYVGVMRNLETAARAILQESCAQPEI